jgi:hypothetical protein
LICREPARLLQFDVFTHAFQCQWLPSLDVFWFLMCSSASGCLVITCNKHHFTIIQNRKYSKKYFSYLCNGFASFSIKHLVNLKNIKIYNDPKRIIHFIYFFLCFSFSFWIFKFSNFHKTFTSG